MDKRKELQRQYKERPVIGGVYRIRNTANDRYVLECTKEMAGSRNRHQFALMTGDCMHHAMRQDWREHGAKSFVFEELATLEKKPEQTDREYVDELKALLELWRDELDPALAY